VHRLAVEKQDLSARCERILLKRWYLKGERPAKAIQMEPWHEPRSGSFTAGSADVFVRNECAARKVARAVLAVRTRTSAPSALSEILKIKSFNVQPHCLSHGESGIALENLLDSDVYTAVQITLRHKGESHAKTVWRLGRHEGET